MKGVLRLCTVKLNKTCSRHAHRLEPGRMDGWMDRQTNEQMKEGRQGGRNSEWVDRWMDG